MQKSAFLVLASLLCVPCVCGQRVSLHSHLEIIAINKLQSAAAQAPFPWEPHDVYIPASQPRPELRSSVPREVYRRPGLGVGGRKRGRSFVLEHASGILFCSLVQP